MFAWAVEEELLPVSVHQALLRVKPLRKGKRMAREKPRVKPVPRAFVDQILPDLPQTIRAMVEVQYLGDMRPQEVVLMRAIDIDMTTPVWEYRPHCYKTEHLNDDGDSDAERVVFLGPRAQEILKPYLTLDVTRYLFSPGRSELLRNHQRCQARKTPLWPSHMRIQAKKKAQRNGKVLKDRYNVAAYRRAIRRACEKVGIPMWSPNQLRHSRSTEIRKRYGLEASKACAGHREIGVTQHYAEQDYDLARRVMTEIG
jgi:integrase